MRCLLLMAIAAFGVAHVGCDRDLAAAPKPPESEAATAAGALAADEASAASAAGVRNQAVAVGTSVAPVPGAGGGTTPAGPQYLPPPSRWAVPHAGAEALDDATRRAKAQADMAAYRASQHETIRDGQQLRRDPTARDRLLAKIADRSYRYSRTLAITVLGDTPHPQAVALLERTISDEDVQVAAEAAVKLYRWGHQREQMFHHLVAFARRGVLVNHAFLLKTVRGQNLWNEDAHRFFVQAVTSSVPRVRINAAVHLLELDTPGPAVEALRRIIVGAPRWSERLDAVSALTSVAYRADVRGLLKTATADVDERVRALAMSILTEAKESTP